MQSDVQNQVSTARKETKGELEAAKKQAHDETQQEIQKLRTEIDGKAIKALNEQKEKIDALSGEMKVQNEFQTKEMQQLRQQLQDQLAEVQKTNQQVLREFQELRNGVQVTYGGVLDFLKVEEALLKSSLGRVQSILHGVRPEASSLPALAAPSSPPTPAPATPSSKPAP